MSELIAIMEAQKISMLNNPFLKDNVITIHLWMSKAFAFSPKGWHGSIEFRNGNTEGKQKFETETFEELARQMNEFLKTL